ncbi:phosphate butyryltransferase [Tepidibacillus fermentans]|uniref:Phosphate butyryltransferase n=1 Tax=Tepidibacillus fermentans TaxID=1281767 RepID=A0A4R3KJV1_9BACI|nr:phosphate butyryltransferase [Tepidibacillus fermentans]TCS84055.1 phosphate butyryltransferase [Tepidibacillus fermentans]
MKSFQDMLKQINRNHPPEVAIALAEDKEVLLAVKEAIDLGIARFHLVGNQKKIIELLQELAIDKDQVKVINEEDPIRASRKAIELVHLGEAQIVMKGLVPTATILKAVLDKEVGLRTSGLISHVAVFEAKEYSKLFMVTDAAMNIAPTLEQKVQIIENAVEFAYSLGISLPKVAPIAAIETINSNMAATIDAAVLSKMADRGQIQGVIIDGPLALDNAISLEAAKHKGIMSQVAGDADILLVPNIEVGNVLYKSLVYFAKAKVGAIVLGAKAPIVLTSRADSRETKLLSICLAVFLVQNKKINRYF